MRRARRGSAWKSAPRPSGRRWPAAARLVFNAPDHAEARRRLGDVLERLGTQVPEVCELVDAAEEDLLAFDGVSRRALEQVALDNPLEHVNREIGRRSDVIGIFPNDASAIRLAGAVRVEQNDEWLVARRYVSEGSMPTVTLRERGPNESHDLDQTKEVTELLAA